jgi:bifunctional non-homologous end joining protein LigD
MALKTYREKRNFTRSPEPAGDDTVVRDRQAKTTGRTPRFFCVQKHLATSLHYDFRIEHNGVLLSWAVPKGPSINSADKRLAMHVEDHPIEYGEFEGVIPDGYGAGVVMLWDRGTWTPETDDVDAALAKGDLKMTLEGYKLKGSWVLVRTKGWGARRPGEKPAEDGKSWLLIKHKDEWAGPVDITTFAPNSVKTGGNFKDILLTGAPDVWQSHKGAGTDTDASLRKIAEKVAALDEPAGEPIGKSKTPAARPRAAKKAAAKKGGADVPAAPKPRTAKRGGAKA